MLLFRLFARALWRNRKNYNTIWVALAMPIYTLQKPLRLTLLHITSFGQWPHNLISLHLYWVFKHSNGNSLTFHIYYTTKVAILTIFQCKNMVTTLFSRLILSVVHWDDMKVTHSHKIYEIIHDKRNDNAPTETHVIKFVSTNSITEKKTIFNQQIINLVGNELRPVTICLNFVFGQTLRWRNAHTHVGNN